jgi:hypothetical protein
MKYDYGQSVQVINSAPSTYKPDCKGCVVGIRNADTQAVATEFNVKVGTPIYTVEFDDYPAGIEIPENFLVQFE